MSRKNTEREDEVANGPSVTTIRDRVLYHAMQYGFRCAFCSAPMRHVGIQIFTDESGHLLEDYDVFRSSIMRVTPWQQCRCRSAQTLRGQIVSWYDDDGELRLTRLRLEQPINDGAWRLPGWRAEPPTEVRSTDADQ